MFRLPEWRRIFRLPSAEASRGPADVDAELAFHLEMRVAELVATGMPEAEARGEAARRFGDLAEARSSLARRGETRARALRFVSGLAELWRDLRLASRGFRRRPGFAAVAIGTLGLGIGLTTAVMAVVNRLVLNPLPYPNANRLGVVLLASQSSPMQISPNLRLLEAWRRSPAPVEWIEGSNSEELLLEMGETAELVQTRTVTPGLLPGLGARIVLGRALTAADGVPGATPVALLSWGTWQRRFGGADALGQSVRLNGGLVTLIGVVGRGFDLTALDGSARAEFWLPVVSSEARGDQSLSVFVLRRPGASSVSISNDLRAATVAAGLKSEMLDKFKATVSGTEVFASDGRAKALWLLAVAVALVLAVACANVAALLLGQSAARAQEFGIRAALGAGRGRVARQLIAESTLLGLLGAVSGLVVAVVSLGLTSSVRPANLLYLDDVRLDWSMLVMAVLVALLATVTFGTAPIWALARLDAAVTLLGRVRRAFDTRFGRSFRSALVVGQLAVTVVLLVGAGVLLRTFIRERNVPTGFDPRGLAWISTDLPQREVAAAQLKQVADAILDAARRVPGVSMAAIAGDSPFGYGILEGEFLIEGRPVPATPATTLIPLRTVTPGYFAAVGMPLRGRTFDSDTSRSEIIIDSATAERWWPTGEAIGSRVRFERDETRWRTVVGIAPESRSLLGGFEDAPFIYSNELHPSGPTLLVRVAHPDRLQAVSRAVRQADGRVRIRSVSSAETALDDRLAGRRFTMTIVIGFAGLALLLAAVGLYGVVALAVSQRTYELGVRIALGAAPAAVQAMVLREGVIRVALGLGVGLIAVLAFGRLLRGLMGDAAGADPLVFVVAGSILAIAGILASWLPARRASRVDPLVALRSD